MEEKVNYIFSINTGRSGSDYLQTIFSHVPECKALREPEPICNGEVMRWYSLGIIEPMRELTKKKIQIIKASRKNHQLYVETNHCFIKGFGWFIPQHIPENKIGVIVLKREIPKIVESQLRVGCSPLTSYGRKWISTPDIRDPIVIPPKVLLSPRVTYQCARFINLVFRVVRLFCRRIFRTDCHSPQWLVGYEKNCIEWYVNETYAKAEDFKQRYPSIKYYEVNIEDLNSIEPIQKMLSYFGYGWDESLVDVVGQATNLKLEWPAKNPV